MILAEPNLAHLMWLCILNKRKHSLFDRLWPRHGIFWFTGGPDRIGLETKRSYSACEIHFKTTCFLMFQYSPEGGK